jgi:hypothetical protein
MVLLPTLRIGCVLLWWRIVDAGEGVLRVPVLVCVVRRMLPVIR